MNLDTNQKSAVVRAVAQDTRLTVITGPAGTGKTTIIKAIADQLNGRVILTAPTGKAAARMKEATGYDAGTIHRELMYDGTIIRRKAAFGLPVIVDEASMVDSWLMAQLVAFNPPKLILVGDADQLAPVGKGQPFHDLIKHCPDSVARLTTCYRSSEAVHIACTAVRAGQMPPANLKTERETWRMMETGDAAKSTEALLRWVSTLYDPERDVILACRYGSGDAAQPDGGIDAINLAVRDLVNPGTSAGPFRERDRVICCKNDGNTDTWNGDMGTVQELADGGMVIRLDRGGDTREIEKKGMADFKLAYALSVHKAQGSQFRRVFFLTLRRQSMMLSRSLIYTAITRAREGVCVFGELGAFAAGLNVLGNKMTVLQALANTSVCGSPLGASTQDSFVGKD